MKGECKFLHPKCKFGSNCTKVLLQECPFRHPIQHRNAPKMIVKSGTYISSTSGGRIECSGVSNGEIKFSDSKYDVWYMGSSDRHGGVHASVNIASLNGKTIKGSWAKPCTNLLIHRLGNGINVQCCRSYAELKKTLKNIWKGNVSGARLGYVDSTDISAVAEFMNSNVEEDFGISDSTATNCTKFAMTFGDTIGYGESRVLSTIRQVLEKIVPEELQDDLSLKLSRLSL